jgi:uncharacterized Zn-finger protein
MPMCECLKVQPIMCDEKKTQNSYPHMCLPLQNV